MPADAPLGVAIDPKNLMDELLLEVVPRALRGKEKNRMCQASGMSSMCSTDYDNLTIIEPMTDGRRSAVIVKFKTAGCSE